MRSPYRETATTTTEAQPTSPPRNNRRERHVIVALTASLFASTLTFAAYRIRSLPEALAREQCNLEVTITPDRDHGWPQSSEIKCTDLVRPLK